jgi:hypothetical protein
MSGQLAFEVERASPIMIVRPNVALDGRGAAELRWALLECLAEQPTGVVVDAIGEVGLTVVGDVARQSLRWPGTRFAYVGDATVAATAARLGLAALVPVHPTPAAAARALAALPVAPVRQFCLEPDRDAPAAARAAVRALCPGQTEPAELIASELVTNAVVHAGTPIGLGLRWDAPRLHIAVRDGRAAPPRIVAVVDDHSLNGRGLILVDAMARDWDALVLRDGKVVWAIVDLTESTP